MHKLYEDHNSLPLIHLIEKKKTIYKWNHFDNDNDDSFFNYNVRFIIIN